ncbi:MAG: AAA family ATPase [Clostridiales bacterium GWF2_36_10]|nr:MAG: AAA family ATPase [Clostridiales bacterium GWF2_36_10]HAN20983.1 AAA family ATPase [Clostridiales bacterium]
MNKSKEIIGEVKKAIIGKDKVLVRVYLAILAGGHILLEDIPGVGKTTMALAFSKALALDYNRMQFTPDVLASDIVGFSMVKKDTGEMEYKKGAIICNLFLADELNRATSRTQAALLEAMEENQVTVDGISHPLPNPFMVIATQNPTGAAGTQLLPDSQMDRFMIKLSIGYPSSQSEVEILQRKQNGNMIDNVKQIVSIEELEKMKAEVEKVYISNTILEYIVKLVSATRDNEFIQWGASPRASLALSSMAKAEAWVQGRDYVIPEDVQLFFYDCIAHRIKLTPEGEESKKGLKWVLDKILNSVTPPAIK